MRLIDADALSEKLCKITTFIKDGEKFQRMINDAPTIEPDGDIISRRAAILAITGEPPEAHYPSWYAERIKALPSVQVEGDLISRQDAIEAFYEPKNGGTYAELDDGSEWYMTSKQIYAVLDSLPSAETSTASEKHQLLEETSTNTSTDLISRQDVIELVKKSYYDLSDGEEDMWAMVHDVEQLPSAPDSRECGEWKPLTDYIGSEYFECSKCHDAFYVEFGTPEDNNYNFCPNCGSLMKKGD